MFAILLHESMDPFYRNIGSFPTVVYSFVLGLCVIYWAGAVLGIVDIDVIDIDGLDAADGSDVATPGVLAGLMLKLGLNGVPVTIIVTFIAMFGWLLCYFGVHFLWPLLPATLLRFIAGTLLLVGTLYIASIVTAQAIKPLRKLFKAASQNDVKHILGQTAVVRTSYVDADFGEAFLADGGAGLILKVRSSGDTRFTKGDRVVLLEYMPEKSIYRIVSETDFAA